MGIVISVAGSLLELHEVIESCCRQTLPDDIWDEDDDFVVTINEAVARHFLKSFDREDLLSLLSKAHSLNSEAEVKLAS